MFKKYNSIDNSYREKTINAIRELGHDRYPYCVLEKAHGACFAVLYNHGEISYAKRSGIIKDGESFYSYQSMVEREEHKFHELFSNIEAEEIIVYGELCGGGYPHPDVPKYNESQVQKGVFYSPKTEFYAFDLWVNGEFLNYDAARPLFERAELLHAKPLHIGTFQECLDYPNRYDTTIPSLLGLPPIENNICEGNVLKPIEPLYFNTGSRVILKNKNAVFSEKLNKKPKGPPQQIPPEIQSALNEVSQYITENRLRNVLSHVGEVKDKDFGKITGLLTKDTLEDATKDLEMALNKEDHKRLNKLVGRECAQLVRNNFVNILDGEF